MKKMELLDLPEELLREICHNLCEHCRVTAAVPTYASDKPWIDRGWQRRALLNLCLTSRLVREISQPVLYHLIDNNASLQTLALQLRTICQRPDLGQHIRIGKLGVFYWFQMLPSLVQDLEIGATRLGLDLNANGWISSDDEDEDEDEEEDEDDKEQASWGYTRRGKLPWDKDRPFETLLQLLLANTPNIDKLVMVVRAIDCEKGEGSFKILAELALQHPGKVLLPNLKEFEFGHEDAGRAIWLDNYAGLFALAPNLQRLEAGDCFGARPPLALNNVTDMKFSSSRLNVESLTAILSSCKGLRRFAYDSGGCADIEDEISPREACQALLRHKDTLEYIRLFHSGRTGRDGNYSGVCEKGDDIVTMREFTALTTLKLDSSCLYITDGAQGYANIYLRLLPEVIETFHVVEMPSKSYSELLTFANSASVFHHLRTVRLNGHERDYSSEQEGDSGPVFDEDELEVLRTAFMREGVVFLERTGSGHGDGTNEDAPGFDD